MWGSGRARVTGPRPWADRGPRIFLSYRRRGDSAGFAARLADHLEAHFGEERCFRDVDDIETGADFVRTIEEAVAACRVMVVVIGTDWVTMKDAQGNRRLDNPEDFVRIEVAMALRRDIRVVPVLVSGASMPSPEELPDDLKGLWRRQALELSDTRWDYDVGQLVAAIEALGVRARAKDSSPLGRRLKTLLVAVAGVGLFALGLVVADHLGEEPGPAGADETPFGAPGLGGGAFPDAGPGDGGPGDGVDPGADTEVTGERGQQLPAGDPGEGPDAAVRYRDALVDAIDVANEEQNFAQESLDIEGLAKVFEGPAYQLQVGEVTRLFQADEVSYNTLLGQRFVDFRVDPSEMFAEVDMVERWSAEHRNAITDACLHRIPAHDVPQTVHLRRTPDGWIVHNITGLPQTTPSPVGC